LSQEWVVPVEDSAAGQGSTKHDIEHAIGIGVVQPLAQAALASMTAHPSAVAPMSITTALGRLAQTNGWIPVACGSCRGTKTLPHQVRRAAPLERDGQVARVILPN
jgi:hypothetical protein